MYIMKTMYLNWKDMEQNNDWVLRDLYAYDKIDMYDIHKIYTRNNLKYLIIKYQRKNSLPN